VVTPASPLLLKGQGTQFVATVWDERGAVLPGVSLAWSVAPPVGVVGADGFFTATTAGAGTVTVAADGVVATIPLRVREFSDLEYVVLPVMLVAADRTSVAGVRQGLARFRSVMEHLRGWYQLRAGRTFPFLEPVWLPTTRTAAVWDQISYATDVPEKRGDTTVRERIELLRVAKEEYGQHFPPPGPKLKIVLVPYTGDSPDVWLGALAEFTGGSFLVAPPRATSVNCPPSGALDSRCADAAYAIGHELGHLLGLEHACQAYQDATSQSRCRMSIMESGKPPLAILLPLEVAALTASPFLSPAAGQ